MRIPRALATFVIVTATVATVACFFAQTREAASGPLGFGNGHAGVRISNGEPAGAWHPAVIAILSMVGVALAGVWARLRSGRSFGAGVVTVVLTAIAGASVWLARQSIGFGGVEIRGSAVPFYVAAAMTAVGGLALLVASIVFRAEK